MLPLNNNEIVYILSLIHEDAQNEVSPMLKHQKNQLLKKVRQSLGVGVLKKVEKLPVGNNQSLDSSSVGRTTAC